MAVGGIAVLALVVAAGYAQAADTYKFTMRGQVKAVDRANNTVTIYGTYVPTDAAKDDLAGKTFEFNASGAKFYKYDKNLKKVRTTIGNVPVQAEVVVKGAKRGDERFNISELTVNPSTFTLVGKIKDHDSTNKILTVEVTTSEYKESTFKGKDIKVYYGANTTFRNNQLGQINSDEVAKNSQKAKISGTVTNGWKFEALSVIDGYEKAR